MLSIIVNTFEALPGWAQFLVVWPLPSTIALLAMVLMIRVGENRSDNYMTNEEERVMWICSIIWPLLLVISIFLAFIITTEWVEDKWESFWTQRQDVYYSYQKAREQKILIRKNGHTHILTKSDRTLCGVGNPMNVLKTVREENVTCPTCLFIIRRNSNGRT